MQIPKTIDFTFFQREMLAPETFSEYFLKNEYQSKNIVLILLACKGILLSDIENITPIISEFKQKNNASFVVVLNQFSEEELPENLSVTPTIQEAYDLIEMETIERDLLSE